VNCKETQNLLHAYSDGELDLVRNLDVEQHLRECDGCSQAYRSLQALRSAVRSSALRFDAPPRLRRNLRRALREAGRPERPPRSIPWRLAPAFGALVLCALVVWGMVHGFPGPSGRSLVAQEVLASHLRSLMAQHLTDVLSSDQHTVKPWFNGKLDFSPPVQDLAKEGFPLAGGRLDYLDGQPVAALVYHRRQHVINLFIWPAAAGAAPGPAQVTERGYHLLHWTGGGMTFWAVSDLNPAELREFAARLRRPPE
jgi:anti-sigma factor RsiW